VSQALVGGLKRTTCFAKKLGGLVIDGAIRAALRAKGLPVQGRELDCRQRTARAGSAFL
jgi:regulator of RNase E activity RraA